jgi:hypothetical protein
MCGSGWRGGRKREFWVCMMTVGVEVRVIDYLILIQGEISVIYEIG